jgi:membrane-associated PAP2 superfamily phosphatase
VITAAEQATSRYAAVTLGSLVLLVLWDSFGFDLELARGWGDAGGFALRHHWLLARWLHDLIKPLPWILTIGLIVMAARPPRGFAASSLIRRWQWPLSALACSVAVGLLKAASGSSCPWDLTEFGGTGAYASHWRGWLEHDGGPGRCFPAGHATNGFAFIGGWFALRATYPKAARVVLVASLCVGGLLGYVQQIRGAHFISHTVWTLWICWTVAWMVDLAIESREVRIALRSR